MNIISAILLLNIGVLLAQLQFSETVELNFDSLPKDKDEAMSSEKRKQLESFYHNMILDKNYTSHSPELEITNAYLEHVSEYNKLIRNSDPPPAAGQCTKKYIRKEFHDLTKEELNKYINAINKLYETPSVRRPGHSAYSEFTMIHVESADEGHSSSQFFPFHRALIFEFEKALQQIDDTITLPYWDWSVDAYYPEISDVLLYYGGSYPNQDKSAGCIKDGPFSHWVLKYPYTHCISRGANLNISNPTRWMNTEELNLLISSNNIYPRFEFEFEVDSHSLVHFWLAGSDDDDSFNIGDMFYMHSPNDPIFWLHHSNVDRIWYMWQQIHDKNFTTYSGASRNSKNLKPSDIMMPWDYDVKSVLNISDLCYDYQPPIKINTPEFKADREKKVKELLLLREKQKADKTLLNTNKLNTSKKKSRKIKKREDLIYPIGPNRKERTINLLQQSQKYSDATNPSRYHQNHFDVLNDQLELDCEKLKLFFNKDLPFNVEDEVDIPLIVPSDEYFEEMMMKQEEFVDARSFTNKLVLLAQYLKKRNIDVPNPQSICKS